MPEGLGQTGVPSTLGTSKSQGKGEGEGKGRFAGAINFARRFKPDARKLKVGIFQSNQ